MGINETVLEMHFHKPLLDLFQVTLGLGKGKFNFYKYSTQKECFVGFDQAFVQTDLTEDELFTKLKKSAIDDGYNLSNFFVGYFLQFKVVKILQRHSRHTPSQVRFYPHYRVSIDTKKNINTGLSQHELLYNLSRNNNAMVYYACPMIFDRSELYNQNIDLDLLRLADLNDCPSMYSDNESHFIYYEDIEAEPVWCSEPVEGNAITPQHMFKRISENISKEEFYESQLELLNKLKYKSELNSQGEKEGILKLVQDSLTIIHYTADKEDKMPNE